MKDTGRYALLLRGVNVGTKNALPMADLRAILARIGCVDVATYVQSGNAVLTTSLSKARLLAAVEAELATYMGRPIATTARTPAELKAILAGNPFAGVVQEPKHLCVTFLSGPPEAAGLAPLLARDWSPERFHVSGSEIYAWFPAGQGRSELAAAIGRLKLEGTATTRNWNTVVKLDALLSVVDPGGAG